MLEIAKSRTLNNRARKHVFAKEDLEDPEGEVGQTSVLDDIRSWWMENVTMSSRNSVDADNPRQRGSKERYGTIARAGGEVQCGTVHVFRDRNHLGFMVQNGILDDPSAFYVVVKVKTENKVKPNTVYTCFKDLVASTTGQDMSEADIVGYTMEEGRKDKLMTMTVSNGTKWDDPHYENAYEKIGIQRFEKLYDWYIVKFAVEDNLTAEEDRKLKDYLDSGRDLYEEEIGENDIMKTDDGCIAGIDESGWDPEEGYFDERGELVGDIPPSAIRACSGPGDKSQPVEHWVKKLGFEKDFPYAMGRETIKVSGADLPEKIDQMTDHEVACWIFWDICCRLREEGEDYPYSLDIPREEKSVKESDDDDTITVSFPEWALNYAVNGEDGGITSEERKMIDEYLDSMEAEGYMREFDYDSDPYFTGSPEFGDACDCVDAKFIKKPGNLKEGEVQGECSVEEGEKKVEPDVTTDKTEDALKTPFVVGRVYRDTDGNFYKVIRHYPTSIVCTYRPKVSKEWSRMKEDIKTLSVALFGEAEKVVDQPFQMTSLDCCSEKTFGDLYGECPLQITESKVVIKTVGDLKRELGKFDDGIKVEFTKDGTMLDVDDMTMSNAVLTFRLSEGYVFEDEGTGEEPDDYFVVKDMHTYGKIPPPVIKTAQKDLYNFMKKNHDHFKKIPLDSIFSILKKNGITPVQEDGTEWEGMLLGNNSNCTIQLAFEGHLIRHLLVLTWYVYDTGTVEVISYIS